MPLGRKSELRRIRTPHPPPVTYLQLYERIGCCGRRHTMRYHCNFLRDKQLRTPIILGARDSPVVRAVVQIGGECFRIESDLLRRILPQVPQLDELLCRYGSFRANIFMGVYFAYNFIKIHRTLRTSPAMAAGRHRSAVEGGRLGSPLGILRAEGRRAA